MYVDIGSRINIDWVALMVEFWQLIFTQSPMELRIMFAVFMAALLWEIFKKA